jgi:hypothetical protein
MHQKRRPVLDESACAHIDPWPNPGTIHTDPDIYLHTSYTIIGARHYEPAIMFPFGNKIFKNASKLLLTFVP